MCPYGLKQMKTLVKNYGKSFKNKNNCAEFRRAISNSKQRIRGSIDEKKAAVYNDQFVFLVLGNVLKIKIEYWKRKD